MAFPATGVLDDFNRADGPLASLNWIEDDPGGFQIAGDALVSVTTSPHGIRWATVFGPDQEVFITLSSFIDAQIVELEFFLKAQSSSGECDAIVVSYHPDQNPMPGVPPANKIDVYTCEAGTFAPPLASIASTLKPLDRFGVRTYADGRIEVYRNNAVVVTATAANSSLYPKSGRIGFWGYGLMSPVTVDDFGGGSL